jgi:hypothetical protein
MKARSLLNGSAYGPERLTEIYEAFDKAWAAIKPLVQDTPLAQEAARLKLANMILAVAADESEPGAIKKKARQAPTDIRDKSSA